MGVFETFFGLPLHPLVIHAAVVFIPLLIVAALVYVLAPQTRAKLNWAVVILGVIAPLSALFEEARWRVGGREGEDVSEALIWPGVEREREREEERRGR